MKHSGKELLQVNAFTQAISCNHYSLRRTAHEVDFFPALFIGKFRSYNLNIN